MTGLPQGWVAAPLMDVVELHDARRIPLNATERATRKGPYPYYGANGQVDSVEGFLFEGEFVLLAEDGGFFDNPARGVAYEAKGRFWVNNHAHILSGHGGIETGFLKQWLNSVDWMKHVSGSTRLKLTQAGMSDVEIPLPPLPEQRRIARKLGTLSARNATARTHLSVIEKLVERYRTAVLETNFKTAWDAGCSTTIAGCLEHAETGLVRSKAEQTSEEGFPYIRMNHYDLAGRWNDHDLTCVAATSSEFDRYQLRANDLLFNTRNSAELVGKVAIWPAGKDGYLFNNNLLRMRFSAEVLPAFAFWQMSSPPFRRYIEGFISATTSVAAIYQRSLMAAPFWVPNTDEQREIVRRIETAFAKIDRLAAEAAKALKLLGHLDQRILAKAFAGDLVPQDPSDEPAETLLARIRETRAVAPKARRGRK